MIQSMTGFGKSTLQLPTKKISIEIKSLNSKSLDLNARMPNQYREKELDMRKLIASSLMRGKVDFSLYIETTSDDTTSAINSEVVKSYMQQLKQVVASDDTELLKMAIKMPDALKTVREEIDETEYDSILNTLKEALVEINRFRTDEGKETPYYRLVLCNDRNLESEF